MSRYQREFRHPWLLGWGASFDSQISIALRQLKAEEVQLCEKNENMTLYIRQVQMYLRATCKRPLCADRQAMERHIEQVKDLFCHRERLLKRESDIRCGAVEHAELILTAKGCMTQLALIYNDLIEEALTIFNYIDYWSGLSQWRFNIMSLPFHWRSTSLKEKVRHLAHYQKFYMGSLGRVGAVLSQLDAFRRFPPDPKFAKKRMPFQLRGQAANLESLLVTIIHKTTQFMSMFMGKMQLPAAASISATKATTSFGDQLRRTASHQAKHFLESLREHRLEFHRRISILSKPPVWQRRWLEMTISASLAVYGVYWAFQNSRLNGSDVLDGYIARLNRTRKDFVFEHITDPLNNLWDELIMNKPFDVVDHSEVVESRRSFEIMLRDYICSIRPGISEIEVDYCIESGRALEILARNYELEVKNPMSSMVRGSIVQMLLIQVQALKKELLQAMEKVDLLLKANHKNIELAATVPAILTGVCAYYASRALYRKVRRRHSRSRMTAEAWIILLDIEQALNASDGVDLQFSGSEGATYGSTGSTEYVNVAQRGYASYTSLAAAPFPLFSNDRKPRVLPPPPTSPSPPDPPKVRLGRCPSWEEVPVESQDTSEVVPSSASYATPPRRSTSAPSTPKSCRSVSSSFSTDLGAMASPLANRFQGMSEHCFGDYLLNIERLVLLVNKHISYVPISELWRLRRDVAELLRAEFSPRQKLGSVSRIQRLTFFER